MAPKDTQAILIADLGYGDAGKGSIVDYLARTTQAHTVVRYNGGAQAAHNVITPGGLHHTFSQFGSGTFIPGTHTWLSRFMITHPLAMLAEERHLQSLGVKDAFRRMHIDRRAIVTTPYQQSANRLKEIARGGARHGSCGLGVGESMSDWLKYGADMLCAGNLDDRQTVIRKLKQLRNSKLDELEPVIAGLPASEQVAQELQIFRDPNLPGVLADVFQYFAGLIRLEDEHYAAELLRKPGTLIFEGAQGVLLDEWFGFFPYNTWSTLTFKNAESLLSENGYEGDLLKLGLLRAYATRHGTGPFVTESQSLTGTVQDSHNTNNPWQREFRVGYLDLVALRYALIVTGKLDGLVVSHLDRLAELPEYKSCHAYQYQGKPANLDQFFDLENGLVKEIKIPPNPTDLDKQEQLTRFLFEMKPVYSSSEKEQTACLNLISRSLGLPVAITSNGPGALDKQIMAFKQQLTGMREPRAASLKNFTRSQGKAIPANSLTQPAK